MSIKIPDSSISMIGDIKASMLSEAQFTAIAGTDWKLCNGGGVSGSEYETITGNSNVPDLRGQFLRGVGGNSAALGVPQGDLVKNHTHVIDNGSDGYANGGSLSSLNGSTTYAIPWRATSPTDANMSTSNNTSGGVENRPTNVAVNYFIKVN